MKEPNFQLSSPRNHPRADLVQLLKQSYHVLRRKSLTNYFAGPQCGAHLQSLVRFQDEVNQLLKQRPFQFPSIAFFLSTWPTLRCHCPLELLIFEVVSDISYVGDLFPTSFLSVVTFRMCFPEYFKSLTTDYSEEFDSNHSLRLQQLEFFGIDGNLSKWFRSYLWKGHRKG